MKTKEKFDVIIQLQEKLSVGQFIVSYLKKKRQYQIGFINGGKGGGYGFKEANTDINICLDKAIKFLLKTYKNHFNDEFEMAYSFSQRLKEKDSEIELLKSKIMDLESGKKKRGRPKGSQWQIGPERNNMTPEQFAKAQGFLSNENDIFKGDIKSLADFLNSQGLMGENGKLNSNSQTSKFSEAQIEREILRANPNISSIPELFWIYQNDNKEFIRLRGKAYRRLWHKNKKNNK